MSNRPDYLATLSERVLVFDGAMGTSIQARELTAEDFGGNEGCNDYLALTRPDVIRAIHASFLAVGCDVWRPTRSTPRACASTSMGWGSRHAS